MFDRLFWVTRPQRRSAVHIAFLLVCLLAGSPSPAQTPTSSPPRRHTATSGEPTRGHLDLEIGYDYRSSARVFGPDGMPVTADPPAVFSAHEATLRARYGLTDRTTAFFALPFLYPALDNHLLEAPLRNPAPLPGDVSLGIRWRLREKLRPYSNLALELRGRAPTGLSAAGPAGSTLLTGTGIPELGLGLSFRRQLGPLALNLAAGYTARLSQVVAYTEVLHEDLEGDARFHPGNQADLALALEVQPASRFWLELSAHASWQETYSIGTTDSRWFPSLDLTPIDGSAGLFADVGGRLWIVLSKRVELSVGGQYRFLGRTLPELAALGLETFSPLPGLSGGLALRLHL